LLLSAMATIIALSQARPIDARPRNCSVSGQVTINGAAAINTKVVAVERSKDSNQPRAIHQLADGSIAQTSHNVRTDADGQYRFTGLPPGEYEIVADSRGYVSAKEGEFVRMVSLDSGESREDINFPLLRGGVITGRITDAEYRPMIAVDVYIQRTEQNQSHPFGLFIGGNHGPMFTDDRGIFRIYGLEAGAYIVYAGGDSRSHGVGKRYPKTFYPNAANVTQAKPIEIKLNEIVSDINLRLTPQGKYFEAIGRVTESDSGQPAANVTLNCDQVLPPDQTDAEGTSTTTTSDQLGNFRMTRLKPGKYLCAVRDNWPKPTGLYVEQSAFEISDSHLSDVEIKVARGGTISGVAVIETPNKQSHAPTFPKHMAVDAHSLPPADSVWRTQTIASQYTYINPDGTFRLTGIPPGKVSFGVSEQHFSEGKMIQLLRIERDGTEIVREFDLGKGEQITNIRIVYGIGTGSIRGQVQIVGGQLPVGCRLLISASRMGKATGQRFAGVEAYVDEKGRFEIGNLLPGEHELRLYAAFDKRGGSTRFSTGNNQPTVQITNVAETRVELTFDPKDIPREVRQ
ncbi:MAG: carboxypeptidase-like regulatory domain-containing protein, partial [Acidobacteriota bacterium]